MNSKQNTGWKNIIPKPLKERWMSKVLIGDKDACWNWLGAKNTCGYGKIRNNYKYLSAHRTSYILHFGDIPKGKHILHKCDNPACVNPNHLFLGDQAINMKDMFKKKRNKNQYSYNSDFVNGRNKPVEGLINGVWVYYKSIADASRHTNTSASKISLVVSGKRNKAGTYKWRVFNGKER